MFAQIGRALDSVMQILGHFVFVLALWAMIRPFDESNISPEMTARLKSIGWDVVWQFNQSMVMWNQSMYIIFLSVHQASSFLMQLLNLCVAGVLTTVYQSGGPRFELFSKLGPQFASIDSCWRSNTTYCFPIVSANEMMTMLRG